MVCTGLNLFLIFSNSHNQKCTHMLEYIKIFLHKLHHNQTLW